MNKMKWISVKDRLPEFYIEGTKEDDEAWHEKTKRPYFSEAILVYGQHECGYWGVFYADYNKRYNWKANKWDEPYFSGIGNNIYNVTHWMPLPDPPTIEQEQDKIK